MLISTLPSIDGEARFEVLGVVQGSTVQSKHLGHDIFAGIKMMVGGELSSYTELLAKAREEALQRMAENAEEMGADGVINVRFATSSIAAGAAEMLAYGTAVKRKGE